MLFEMLKCFTDYMLTIAPITSKYLYTSGLHDNNSSMELAQFFFFFLTTH